MSYYYVLGHKNNPVIEEYSDKFFVLLLERFEKMPLPENMKRTILDMDKEKKYHFFMKVDISFLVQDYTVYGNESSVKKLEKECNFFIAGEEEKCTYSLGDIIPGTNIKLTTHDNNEDNGLSSHPDHDSGKMIGWGERPKEEWMEVYAKSLDMLKNVNKDFYDELDSIIQKIIPFNTSREAHNSCSYKESIGVLYLGYALGIQHPEISILEALIHESSHNKLNLIMQSDPLTLNEKVERFYSPYRPDARHIYGVYLGVHAIVPTVHTMLRAVEDGFITEITWQNKAILYHIKNKIGMRVLRKYAKCTDLGYKILDELEAVMKLCDRIIATCPELKRLDLSDIQKQAKVHFLEVQKDYPFLQY